MTVSVISAREERLMVKPPKVNPFRQIWGAFKKMPKAFIRTIASFLLAFVATYQCQAAFSDFMGSENMHGSNADDAGGEMKKKYQEGVSCSMMRNVMNNVVQLIYGFCNDRICKKNWNEICHGYRQLFDNSSLLMFLFITNKCIYLLLAGLIGLGMVIHMAIPYAIVPIVMPTEELGNSLGLLNCFGVIGQQISNFLIGTGVGKVVNNSPGKKIGYSAVFGFLTTVASFWVIEPSIGESEKYSLIYDAATDFNYISEVK